MRLRVLLLAQDATARAEIAKFLTANGCAIEVAAGSKRAREVLASESFPIAIVAVSGESEIALVRELCSGGCKVIVFAGQPSELDRLRRTVPQAAAFLAQPLDKTDLQDELARVTATFSKSSVAETRQEPQPSVLLFEGRTLDLSGRTLLDPLGREIGLTRLEFELLAHFTRNPGRVLTRDQLRQALSGQNADAFDRSIDMLVGRVRRKVELDPKSPRIILTVPGVGYKFDARPAPVQALRPEPYGGALSPSLERRQLTVLACRIDGLATISTRYDPEDLLSLSGAVHEACKSISSRFRGTATNALGDTLLVYFGHGGAAEDDAERAVRAALALVSEVPDLSATLREKLRARVGIATSIVVIEASATQSSGEGLKVTGEAVSLALHLCTAAPPDAILLSARTRDLLGGLFAHHEAESLRLGHNTDRLRVWRVTGERRVSGRFNAYRTGMPTFIGREAQLELLSRYWSTARTGWGHMVMLLGEAGIGKSRLAAQFEQRLSGHPCTIWRYFGAPHFAGASFSSILAEVQGAADFEPSDSAQEKFAKLKALFSSDKPEVCEGVSLLAEQLSLPIENSSAIGQLTPHKRKERIFAALFARIENARQPLLLMVEDAQWIDPTSMEFVARLVDRLAKMPILMVLGARPEFVAPWLGHAHVTSLSLARLSPDESRSLIAEVYGNKPLPAHVVNHIVSRADGVPLFVEELTRGVLESGLPTDGGVLAGHFPIPATLHGALLARLDQLGPAKEIAQTAAVIGREFAYELLRQVAGIPSAVLDAALERLVEMQLAFRRGIPPSTTFVFKHALVRDAAYGMLLRARRQQLHATAARLLEEGFREIVETQPELLGHHFAEAGDVSKAVSYLIAAGERSLLQAAITEALGHLTRALNLLSLAHEDDGRRRQELILQSVLSRVWVAKKGHASSETYRSLARARELCEALDDQAQLPIVIYGQWGAAWGRAQHALALKHGQALLEWGQRTNNVAGKTYGHFTSGVSSMPTGALTKARRHLEAAVALDGFEASPFGDLLTWRAGVGRPTALLSLHNCLFLQGRPAQAKAMADTAISEIRNISHFYARAIALSMLCRMHALRRDAPKLSAAAGELRELSTAEGYPHFAANSVVFRGWSMVQEGDVQRGIEQVRSGIESSRTIGYLFWLPQFLAMLAECRANAGDFEGALGALDEAAKAADETGERVWEPELHRQRGEIYMDFAGDYGRAEGCLAQALAASRRQGARLLEWRAATTLARIWTRQGREAEARAVLRPLLNRFRDGLDSGDLQRATAVWDTLGRRN